MEEVIPVVKVKDVFVAELWHGATLAFKDLALSCVGQFMAYFNAKGRQHVTIIVSTSGDTGSAAIESIRHSDCIDIVVMFPKGRCSKVQELQMTTVLDENVHVFCGEGTSDDLDIPLKNCLTNSELVKRHGLCSLNSINWARIMIQIAHHFYVYFQARLGAAVDTNVDIFIPTGGAGNITGTVCSIVEYVEYHIICHLYIIYISSYHIISYYLISHIISYHIIYHIIYHHIIISYYLISHIISHISYHIISYHIISYHIISSYIIIIKNHIISYIIYRIIYHHIIYDMIYDMVYDDI